METIQAIRSRRSIRKYQPRPVPHEVIEQIVAGFAGTKKPYVVIENRREAIRWAMDHAKKDDIIVLAGKGHETYQILGTVKTHLDEREEVAAHLAGH